MTTLSAKILKRIRTAARCAAGFTLFGSLASAAETTNTASAFSTGAALPDVGASVVRVMGALGVVLGLFLAGVWLFRNWQRLMVHRGRAPKLNVLEVRSLGSRQSIYVVAYEQERFLLASSPTGVNFLSHLPVAEESLEEKAAPPAAGAFAHALRQVLGAK